MSEKNFIDWATFEGDVVKLAKALMQAGDWHAMIAISRGGLVPAGILSRLLNIRLVDTVAVASYDGEKQGDAQLIKSVSRSLMANFPKGEGLLVIDDLVDTGVTAKLVRSLLPQAHYGVIYAKPAGRNFADTYARDMPQDEWIVFPWENISL